MTNESKHVSAIAALNDDDNTKHVAADLPHFFFFDTDKAKAKAALEIRLLSWEQGRAASVLTDFALYFGVKVVRRHGKDGR